MWDLSSLTKDQTQVPCIARQILFFFFLIFIFGCTGSSWMCTGFLWLQRAEASPGCGVQAYGGGFSCCGAQALGGQALVSSLALEHVGSIVVVQGLSCPMAGGIFPGQRLNPCPLHWQVVFLSTQSPGKSIHSSGTYMVCLSESPFASPKLQHNLPLFWVFCERCYHSSWIFQWSSNLKPSVSVFL